MPGRRTPARLISATLTVERASRAGEDALSATLARERLVGPREVASARTLSGLGLG